MWVISVDKHMTEKQRILGRVFVAAVQTKVKIQIRMTEKRQHLEKKVFIDGEDHDGSDIQVKDCPTLKRVSIGSLKNSEGFSLQASK